jgi:peptidyl-prolyl cis-trans isomerase C
MKKTVLTSLLVIASAALLPLSASAQNIATVNGKAVPKSRVELLISQVTRNGQQQRTPELEAQARDEVVLREIFAQEATKRGIPASTDYQAKLELTKQGLMINELFEDFIRKNPVNDAEAKAEYDKAKAQASGTEYRARHILVEKEDEAKTLIAQIKAGAGFDDLAKKSSKDTGSAEHGGDLDWANPNSYVPEFSQAMVKLKKGEMTDTPVKSQFGYHIIKLEDTREAKFPAFEEVKAQIQQRIGQQKLAKFRDEMKDKAKTDYKFSR